MSTTSPVTVRVWSAAVAIGAARAAAISTQVTILSMSRSPLEPCE